MQKEIKRAYHYSDICLVPQRGHLISRSKADTNIHLGSRTFQSPVIPSNMKCTIDHKLAQQLAQSGYFYIMHRFDNNINFINEALESGYYISISVGVKNEDKLLIKHIKENNIGVDYITIDIAHGHSLQVLDMIKYIKDNLSKTFIIAGNIATAEAAIDLELAGANAIKVGIGQGNACTTKDKTGFTVPMFTCIHDIAGSGVKLPIIADGGVKCNGDIAKAIVAGASMVMCGSLFAECKDSPSDTFLGPDGQSYKLYFGSASEYNKNDTCHIEGTLKKIPQNTLSYAQKYEELCQDLSSAISYCGGTTLKDLKGYNNFYATK
jgi:GMP reductase